MAHTRAGAHVPSFDHSERQSFAELLLSEQILICLVLVLVSDCGEADCGLIKALADRWLPLLASATVVKLMTWQRLKAGHSFSQHSSANKR